MQELGKEILYSEGTAYKVFQNEPTLEYKTNGNDCYGAKLSVSGLFSQEFYKSMCEDSMDQKLILGFEQL